MTCVELTTLLRVFLIVVMNVFTWQTAGWNFINTLPAHVDLIMALQQESDKEYFEGACGAGLVLTSDNGKQLHRKAM